MRTTSRSSTRSSTTTPTPPKVLIIGPDTAGNLLELIGGVLQEGDVICHAMPCRKQYLDLLPTLDGEL